MKTYISAFVAFISTCIIVMSCFGRERCTEYHYVNGFPESFHEPAEYAAARWTHLSGIPVTIGNGNPSDLACGLRLMSKNSSEYVGLKIDTNTDFWGMHRGDDGSISLVLDAWPPDDQLARARSILMHEIAHEFWLEHIPDTNAVMGIPTQHEPHTDYNESDRNECVRVGTCRRESLQEFEAGVR